MGDGDRWLAVTASNCGALCNWLTLCPEMTEALTHREADDIHLVRVPGQAWPALRDALAGEGVGVDPVCPDGELDGLPVYIIRPVHDAAP